MNSPFRNTQKIRLILAHTLEQVDKVYKAIGGEVPQEYNAYLLEQGFELPVVRTDGTFDQESRERVRKIMEHWVTFPDVTVYMLITPEMHSRYSDCWNMLLQQPITPPLSEQFAFLVRQGWIVNTAGTEASNWRPLPNQERDTVSLT